VLWRVPPPSKTNPCRTVDANGNLIQKTENGSVWAYTWNAEDQLTRVTKDSAEVATFAYDPLGRRVEKAAGAVTTSFAYDGEDILRETRTGGTVFKYVHGRGIDEPFAREDGAAALTYYHADGLGSILKRSNQVGTLLWESRYDAWGQVEAGAGEPGYGYVGRESDPETGLLHVRARYLDSQIGRFLTEDPKVIWRHEPGFSAMPADAVAVGPRRAVQERNLYLYAIGNPATFFDPDGRAAAAWGGRIVLTWIIGCGIYSQHLGLASLSEFRGDNYSQKAHCYGACLYNRCLLKILPFVPMAAQYAWEFVTGFAAGVSDDTPADNAAAAWGIRQSYGDGDCKLICSSCPIPKDYQ